MNSMFEHNQELQKSGMFSAADLEENKQGRYTPAQIEQEKSLRASMRAHSKKYDNKKPVIILIFGIGFVLFCAVLYFVGVFGTMHEILKGLFIPVMLGALLLAALMIFVVIPNQYQSSVDMGIAMGASLDEQPMGAIQTIEARAETHESQGGINRRGHQSSKISYILKMDSIEFRLSDTFWKVIQPKRMYRVCAVKNDGWWQLLSIETLE